MSQTSSLCGTWWTHNTPNITQLSKEKDLSDLLVLHSDKFGNKGTPQCGVVFLKQNPLVITPREETKYCLDLEKRSCFVCCLTHNLVYILKLRAIKKEISSILQPAQIRSISWMTKDTNFSLHKDQITRQLLLMQVQLRYHFSQPKKSLFISKHTSSRHIAHIYPGIAGVLITDANFGSSVPAGMLMPHVILQPHECQACPTVPSFAQRSSRESRPLPSRQLAN